MNSAIRSTSIIFKVSVGLCESNPNAYKLKVISIGPYHKHNPELRSMKKYKLCYLQRFLHRKEGIDVESCTRELEDEALKCYDDIENLDSDIVGNFSKILLLDGCFLVEFIRERCGMCPKVEGWIIPENCISIQVNRDLLLIENQLPFFVLTKLHHMTKGVEQIPFIKMVKKIFLHSLSKMTLASYLESEANTDRKWLAFQISSLKMITFNRHLLKLLHDPVFLHVYMEQNSAADQLAKAGSRMQCDASLHVFEEPPLFVSSNLRADQIGVTTQRTVTTTATPEAGCQDILVR
ncbi:UPF0481 protein At3g47200-like [Nicotiana tomentosiformis]|uniref:UPF0481 protein At3g47200-like n=1 Tax=Nicotiana tomentosiformis TaxID=4098 RepID=UPI00388C6F87